MAEPEFTDKLRVNNFYNFNVWNFKSENAKENQVKLKELEFKEKELTVQLKMHELESHSPVVPAMTATKSPGFDVSKHIRLVPPFQEKEVDKYFVHFEKIVTSLESPRKVWTLLLQSLLIGKAREIYLALPVEKSTK